MKSVTSIILFFVISARVFSAEFSGVVMDKHTMEPIPYASINVVDLNFLIECDSVGTFHMNANVHSNQIHYKDITKFHQQFFWGGRML